MIFKLLPKWKELEDETSKGKAQAKHRLLLPFDVYELQAWNDEAGREDFQDYYRKGTYPARGNALRGRRSQECQHGEKPWIQNAMPQERRGLDGEDIPDPKGA